METQPAENHSLKGLSHASKSHNLQSKEFDLFQNEVGLKFIDVASPNSNSKRSQPSHTQN